MGPLPRVQVKDFDPELKKELRKARLVEDQVQIAVERRLEKAGITVQTEEQFRKSTAKAVLLIKLELLMPEAVQKVRYTFTEEGERVPKPDEDPKYAYRTDVVLRQNVLWSEIRPFKEWRSHGRRDQWVFDGWSASKLT